MKKIVNHEKLICYQKALRITQELGQVMRQWPRGYGYLADQGRRAVSSIVLNTAEGNSKTSSPERKRFFAIARASAAETAAVIDLAGIFHLLSSSQSLSIKSEFRQISAILSALS